MRIPRTELPPGTESATFARWLDTSTASGGDALDLGTGTGRVALRLASRMRHVYGIDVDASMIEAATAAAGRLGVNNATFLVRDAEAGDWSSLHAGQPFDVVAARLFWSLPLADHAAQAVRPGGWIVLEALEAEHWREAGGSRFNLAAEDIEASLRPRFDIVEAVVERRVLPVMDTKAGKRLLQERRLFARWSQDGRWQRWRATLRSGGTLTDAHLVLAARRRDDGL